MQQRKHTSPPITQCHISTSHEADRDSEVDQEDLSRTDSALPSRRKLSHQRGRSGGGLLEEHFKNNLTIANQSNLASSTPAGLDNLPAPNGSLPRSAVRQLPRHLVADDGFHSDSGIGSSVTVNGSRSDGPLIQTKVRAQRSAARDRALLPSVVWHMIPTRTVTTTTVDQAEVHLKQSTEKRWVSTMPL